MAASGRISRARARIRVPGRHHLELDGSAIVNSTRRSRRSSRSAAWPQPQPPRAVDAASPIRRQAEAMGCHVDRVSQPSVPARPSFHSDQCVTGHSNARILRPARLVHLPFVARRHVIHYNRCRRAGREGCVRRQLERQRTRRVQAPLAEPDRLHNVRRLEDNAPGDIRPRQDPHLGTAAGRRRAGAPVEIQARWPPESILTARLWLFAGAFAAAVAALAGLIWWTVRKGRSRLREAAARSPVS